MRATLFPFQEVALADLHEKIQKHIPFGAKKTRRLFLLPLPRAQERQLL